MPAPVATIGSLASMRCSINSVRVSEGRSPNITSKIQADQHDRIRHSPDWRKAPTHSFSYHFLAILNRSMGSIQQGDYRCRYTVASRDCRQDIAAVIRVDTKNVLPNLGSPSSRLPLVAISPKLIVDAVTSHLRCAFASVAQGHEPPRRSLAAVTGLHPNTCRAACRRTGGGYRLWLWRAPTLGVARAVGPPAAWWGWTFQDRCLPRVKRASAAIANVDWRQADPATAELDEYDLLISAFG